MTLETTEPDEIPEVDMSPRRLTDADLLRQARATLHAAMQGGSRTGAMDTEAALAVWQTMREAERRPEVHEGPAGGSRRGVER
jgi:hypothetical protein